MDDRAIVWSKTMRQAVILAAGRGSRMLEATADRPKCLIPLGGKTILQWQIDALTRAGIEKIVLVTGYLHPLLAQEGYPCFCNEEWEGTNMVASLCIAHEVLSREETLVVYGDIVYNAEIVVRLFQSKQDIAMTYDLLWRHLWQERFANPLQDAETFRVSQGRVVDIGARPNCLEEIEGQYMGLLKITPQGWGRICDTLGQLPSELQKQIDMTTLLRFLIAAHIPVEGIAVRGKWCELDSLSDLAYYERQLQKGLPWFHDWR